MVKDMDIMINEEISTSELRKILIEIFVVIDTIWMVLYFGNWKMVKKW